jgi:hypothetical protein
MALRVRMEKAMSTYAVFGMTRFKAEEIARKKTPSTRNGNPIPLHEWLASVEVATDMIMQGNQIRRLSELYDAPQFAEQFIALARSSGACRDLHVKAFCVLKGIRGEPIHHSKTGAKKRGFVDV